MKTLKRLKLKNLLSFGNPGIDLELRPLNVLIGANGSGKSNLIEAISLLKSAPSDFSDALSKRINGFGVLKFVNPELVAPKSIEAKRFFEFLKTRTSQLEK